MRKDFEWMSSSGCSAFVWVLFLWSLSCPYGFNYSFELRDLKQQLNLHALLGQTSVPEGHTALNEKKASCFPLSFAVVPWFLRLASSFLSKSILARSPVIFSNYSKFHLSWWNKPDTHRGNMAVNFHFEGRFQTTGRTFPLSLYRNCPLILCLLTLLNIESTRL